MVRNVSTEAAAAIIGKNPMFIRMGLRLGRLPFGTAIECEGGKWSYHISEKKLREYIGDYAVDSVIGDNENNELPKN